MTGVLTAYREEIARGALQSDPAQEGAAAALQELFDEVVSQQAEGSIQRRFRRRLLGGFLPFESGSVDNAWQGVYLHGPVGRGKTRLMDLFFNALPETVLKQRVHFHAFMLSVHDFMHRARQAGGRDGVDGGVLKFAEQVSKTARILCFDEFHVVDVADAMILSRLMRALFSAGVRVVLTSNWKPDELYKNGLQRDLFLPFIDLVQTRLRVVAVEGGRDYRMARIAGKPTYFSPNGTASFAAFNGYFADLTDGEAGASVSLNVMGHVLILPRAGHGVAWAGFADLCEKPLAAQDYLALARAFHTVMIDHVPRLTYDRRNETKRLMILVDILYEHRRRLIVAAEAALDKLFVDNEHAFEFTRTLSRLTEMQSAAYLDRIDEEYYV